MKKSHLLGAVMSMVLVFGIVGTAGAVPVLLDFENPSYNDYQNISDVDLGGVTLYGGTNRLGGVYVVKTTRVPNLGLSSHSGETAIGNFTTNIGATQNNPLTGVFSTPVTFVSLWGGDGGGDGDQWQLEVFDAVYGGNSLGLVTTPIWDGSPYENLSITVPRPTDRIYRFEATWIDFFSVGGIGYDDLEFTPRLIPLPAAVWLFGSGLLGLIGIARRKKTA